MESRNALSSAGTPAKAQQEKVRPEDGGKVWCVACVANGDRAHVGQAAHGLPLTLWGCDHPDCVIPLCEHHHPQYDGHAGETRLVLFPALLSEAAREEFRSRHGHRPNPKSHHNDFDLLVDVCPDTFGELIELIAEDRRPEISHMYDAIKKNLRPDEWPFARYEIPDISHLPFKWLKAGDGLTPYTVLCAILFLSSAVLVKRNIDHWSKEYWWYFFREHKGARTPENLKWYFVNNPKFREWFKKERPDTVKWSPWQSYSHASDAGDCLVCAANGREVSGRAVKGLPASLWDVQGCTFVLCERHGKLFAGEVNGGGLMLFPAILSRQAQGEYEQVHGHRPNPVEHRGDLDVLLDEFPSTFDALAAILDPVACAVVGDMLGEIEKFLVDAEWPFRRWEIDCVGDLPFGWISADDELTPYMVLAAILVFGTGVLVEKRIDDWEENAWWRFFKEHQEARAPENLKWYRGNNPRFERWFLKHKPDEFGWSVQKKQTAVARARQIEIWERQRLRDSSD